MKVTFYLDGQNIHYAMANLNIDSYNFDFRGYCHDFVKKWNSVELSIKYYGAIYPREIDQYKNNKDSDFFNHLEEKQQVVVRKGTFNFDRKNLKMPPREKGVDVLLAVDLIVDSFHQKYDQAIIFSNDTDLIPAIIEARKIRSSVKVHNLSRNPLHDFRKECDHAFKIHDHKLKKFNNPKARTASKTTLEQLVGKFKKD